MSCIRDRSIGDSGIMWVEILNCLTHDIKCLIENMNEEFLSAVVRDMENRILPILEDKSTRHISEKLDEISECLLEYLKGLEIFVCAPEDDDDWEYPFIGQIESINKRHFIVIDMWGKYHDVDPWKIDIG